MMQKTPLTEMDRRMLAQLEGLYGPPRRAAVPATARRSPATRARRPVGSLLRTVLLVGVAYVLVTGTEPGRTMYVWTFDQLGVIYAAAIDVFR
jgi:hypothetical protein